MVLVLIEVILIVVLLNEIFFLIFGLREVINFGLMEIIIKLFCGVQFFIIILMLLCFILCLKLKGMSLRILVFFFSMRYGVFIVDLIIVMVQLFMVIVCFGVICFLKIVMYGWVFVRGKRRSMDSKRRKVFFIFYFFCRLFL